MTAIIARVNTVETAVNAVRKTFQNLLCACFTSDNGELISYLDLYGYACHIVDTVLTTDTNASC